MKAWVKKHFMFLAESKLRLLITVDVDGQRVRPGESLVAVFAPVQLALEHVLLQFALVWLHVY